MTEEIRTFDGATLEEARANAAEALRSTVGELQVEVLEDSPGDGVRIRAAIDPAVVVGAFLAALFRSGELELQARIGEENGVLVGELGGTDLRLLTGGSGRGLDALQYLCNRVLNRRVQHHPPVHLDTDGFKDRRARKLQDEAESAADEAVRTRREVVLGPYTPAARREIHLALADDPAVETESDGEGFLKRVVVRPRRRR